MTSLSPQLESPASSESPRVRFEPARFHGALLDGSWWPSSIELDAELRTLVPVLDHVRGPVTRLLLSAAGWATRPYQIIMGGRTVTIGYLAGHSPSMMTVLCADGGTFTMRVAPPGPASGAPDRPESGGGLGLLPERAVR